MADELNRRAEDQRLNTLITRVDDLHSAHCDLKSEVAAIKENTDRIVEFFRNAERAVNGIAWVSRGLRWFGKRVLFPLVAAYVMIYAYLHHGDIPDWFPKLVEFFK